MKLLGNLCGDARTLTTHHGHHLLYPLPVCSITLPQAGAELYRSHIHLSSLLTTHRMYTYEVPP